MPIVGITLDSTREVESSLDAAKGTPEATKFTIGTLDSRVFGMLRDKGTSLLVDPSAPGDEVNTQINAGEVAFLTVQFGLKGWKNFRDESGHDIEFKTLKRFMGGKSYTIVDPNVLMRLPNAVLTELAEQIRKDNELSGAEAKN